MLYDAWEKRGVSGCVMMIQMIVMILIHVLLLSLKRLFGLMKYYSLM